MAGIGLSSGCGAWQDARYSGLVFGFGIARGFADAFLRRFGEEAGLAVLETAFGCGGGAALGLGADTSATISGILTAAVFLAAGLVASFFGAVGASALTKGVTFKPTFFAFGLADSAARLRAVFGVAGALAGFGTGAAVFILSEADKTLHCQSTLAGAVNVDAVVMAVSKVICAMRICV
ncbi:MAG: hypothetical protein MK098_14515 [Marinovum sp.]|nr:hypothetical protein [Marinovum sp.]